MAATDKTIVLITGANSGIGLELAAHLFADASQHVLMGCRSVEKGQKAIAELESRKPNQPGTLELLHVDVSDENSIKAAAKTVEETHGRLDALVSNAGIVSNDESKIAECMATVYNTNVIGPYLMGIHFAPLLRKSIGTPRIINVSSGAGSIARHLDESPEGSDVLGIPYRASKAALNMVTAHQAVHLGKTFGFKTFSYCPGFCVSNLTHSNIPEYTARTSSVGSAPMVGILKGERDAEHGGFLHGDGTYPW